MINKYRTWIFDCDGVLLDSNKIKTNSFFEAALPYGKVAAEKLIDYHTKNGGISRYKKFEYLFQSILHKQDFKKDFDQALLNYGIIVKNKLFTCPESPGLRDFLGKLHKQSSLNTLVVSGGDQAELREVLDHKGLNKFFNMGIFGSPETKLNIVTNKFANGEIIPPAVFIGDTKYDYECAKAIKADFIFMIEYTEFNTWQSFFKNKNIKIIKNLTELEL